MPTSESRNERRPAARVQDARRELRRADRLARGGQVTEANQSVEHALLLGADRYTCYLRLARLYQTQHQIGPALTAAEKAIEEEPDKLGAREALIALYLESRDYARAVQASQDLLKLSPRHVPARDALGAAYIGLGQMEAAMRVANDLIRLDPSNVSHRFTRAILCQHRGDTRLAVDEFQRVMGMAPESDLADSAREQLEVLDSFQLRDIVTLAMEDVVFRGKLVRDSDLAAAERGFFLSEEGRDRLREFAADELADIETPSRPLLYN